jgi:hypothetical protein
MAKNNPVSQVLVASGNAALLAAGSRPSSLAHGQLGIFNYHTGLSVDGSVITDCNDVYIAVGINRTAGTGSMEDLRQSAGQSIQTKKVSALTVKGYVAEVAKIVDITGFTAKCDADYVIRAEFRSVAAQMLNGYNNVTKIYSFHTGCCADECTDCGDGDPVELAVGIAASVNADPDALLTATLFQNKIVTTMTGPASATGTLTFTVGTETFTASVTDADTATVVAAAVAAAINAVSTSNFRASSSGAVLTIYRKTGVTTSTQTIAITGAVAGVGLGTPALSNGVITDTAAFSTAYPGAGLNIRLTGTAEVRPAFGDINVKYHKTGLNFIVSFSQGFGECNGDIETAQELQYAEGLGYDVKQLEYLAGGQNGNPGPYRVTVATGFAKPIEYLTVATSNYNVAVMTYDLISSDGEPFENGAETIIAIPCADSTTLVSLFTMLDLIFAGRFGAMTNDVASMDCTNGRTGLLVAATDGIESVAS